MPNLFISLLICSEISLKKMSFLVEPFFSQTSKLPITEMQHKNNFFLMKMYRFGLIKAALHNFPP